MKTLRYLSLAVVTAMALAGCHKAPKQHNPGTPPNFSPDPLKTDTKLREVTHKPGDTSSVDTSVEPGKSKRTQEEEDNLVRANVQKPILYGVGVAGVDLTTTEDVLANKLSEPVGYYNDNMVYLYKENVLVVWGASKPRTPQLFVVYPGYLGTIELPAPYGAVRVGTEYPQFFTNDPTGSEFIKAIYRAFEKEDASYDCLERGSCQINDSDPEVLVFETPGAQFFFSRDDRRALSNIYIQKAEKSPEDFNNDFDLARGRVLVSESQNIDLGTTWADARAKARTDSPSFVNPNYFFKRFLGINMSISRSHYEHNYNEPSDNEILEQVQIAAPFAKNIRIGKKFVRLTPDAEKGVKLVLEDALAEDGIYLKPAMPKGLLRDKPELQKELLRQLAESIKAEIEASAEVKALRDAGATVFIADPLYRGFNNTLSNASFTASVDYYALNPADPSASFGRQIWFRTVANEDNIFFSVSIYRGDYHDVMAPATFKGAELGSGSLGGFALGETLLLSDEDLGRGEVTVNSPREDGSLRSLRSIYQPDSRTQVAYSMAEEFQALEWVQIGDVNIGVNKTGRSESIDGKTMAEAEINVIASGSLFGGIKGLCGLDQFETRAEQPLDALPMGMAEKALTTSLKNTLATAGSTCSYYAPVDSNQNEQDKTQVLYFPNQQAKLYFFDHELSSVMIFKKPSAAQGGN